MGAGSEGRAWVGTTGRSYRRLSDEPIRHGCTAKILAVAAEGDPVGTSMVSPGTRLALRRLNNPDDPALQHEVEYISTLSAAIATPPCPRVYDIIDGVGPIMEWCPHDLEQWWLDVLTAPAGLRGLLKAMSELSRRISETLDQFPLDPPPLIKPRALLRRQDGRWLLSRFGAPPRPDPDATAPPRGAIHYASPEVLFEATGVMPDRAAVWSLGGVMMSMLTLRSLVHNNKPIPEGGSDSPGLRSHHATLIADLYANRPALFRARALAPNQFVYPDALPGVDQQSIATALHGILSEDAEAELARQMTETLQRALCVDPARRMASPAALADEFDAIGRWLRDALKTDPHRPQAKRPPPPPDKPTGFRPGPITIPPVPAVKKEAFEALEAKVNDLEAQIARKGSSRGLFFLMLLLQVAIAAVLIVDWRRLDRALSVVVVPPPNSAPVNITLPRNEPEKKDPEPAATPEPEPTPEPTPELEPELRPEPVAVPVRPPASRPTRAGAADGTGRVVVSGAHEAYLIGPAGRAAPGTVPAGLYEVFVTLEPDGAASSMGTVEVVADGVVQFRCGFGTCRRAQ
ncbi:MAG: hypothetical protein AAFV53_14715 [Myxococcota bacterium]